MNEQPDFRPEDETPSFPAPEEALPAPDEEEISVGPEAAPLEQAGAEPPRVVAETPVGGLRPAAPLSPRPSAETPPDAVEPSAPPADKALADDEAAPTPSDETIRLTLADVAPSPVAEQELPPSSDLEAVREEAEKAAEEAVIAAPTMAASETEAEEIELAAPPAAAEAALSAPPAAEESTVPTEPTPVSLVNAALAAVAEEATAAEIAESAPAEAEQPVVTSPQEWDEDLSPELAAVLFGSPRRAAVAEISAAPPEAAAPPAVAPAEVIALTSDEQAATLPLSVGDQRAPAPEVALTGKVRYTRVEEPLPDDRGQHIVETWVYVKPELPALEGRLVQRVTREEWRYSDGSWRWRYERRYADRGRDSREVRANAARTYFERADSISQRDATTGKRQQFSEEAVLIFATPVQEEKRGWLRNLFRRGNDHEPAGEKTWRPATSTEIRQARRSGEQALRRGGLFG